MQITQFNSQRQFGQRPSEPTELKFFSGIGKKKRLMKNLKYEK